MNKHIEGEKPYLIPIINTGTNWEQTQKIPVIRTKFKIPNSNTVITYLKFVMRQGESLGLDISAGDTNLKIAGARIRAQMMHRLEVIGNFLQKPDPPPNVYLEFQLISQYFSPRNNASGAQPGQ